MLLAMPYRPWPCVTFGYFANTLILQYISFFLTLQIETVSLHHDVKFIYQILLQTVPLKRALASIAYLHNERLKSLQSS